MSNLRTNALNALAALRPLIPRLNISAGKDPRQNALADIEAYLNAPPPEPVVQTVTEVREPTEDELKAHLEKLLAAEGHKIVPIAPEPPVPVTPVPAPPTVERPKEETPPPADTASQAT